MKSKKLNQQELKSLLLKKIQPKPKNLSDLEKNMNVLDITMSFDIKLKRDGKITEIDLNKGEIFIKYETYELVTKLQYYGYTWGLL